EHLGRVLAQRFQASMQQRFQSAPFHQEPDPLARVFGFVDFLAEMSSNPVAAKGCLLGTFVQELADTHPEIRSVCASCFDEQANPPETAPGEGEGGAPPRRTLECPGTG